MALLDKAEKPDRGHDTAAWLGYWIRTIASAPLRVLSNVLLMGALAIGIVTLGALAIVTVIGLMAVGLVGAVWVLVWAFGVTLSPDTFADDPSIGDD